MRVVQSEMIHFEGYGCRRRKVYCIQDQVRMIVVLSCLLGHLALFQLSDASTQSSSSPGIYFSLGNGQKRNDSLKDKENRGQAVISLVPEKDRGLFIMYHLNKVLKDIKLTDRITMTSLIPAEKTLFFKDIRTYDTFSTDLLKWIMETFKSSQYEVYSLLRRIRVLCTSKGFCFNPNDIGSMCCPF